jgi:Phytanoyl-CoA dioxygenase (PhyH)
MTQSVDRANQSVPQRALPWLLAPLHAMALFTAAKSFRDNPIIGHPALNAAGLHIARVGAAAAVSEWRRRRLAHLISAADAADFERNGFILKQHFLPADVFGALRHGVLTLQAPARAMIQGDAVTRRIPLDAYARARLPILNTLLDNPQWLGLIRYAGASALTPVSYVQTIFSRVRADTADPQLHLHSDTFHATVKAWLFLTDVAEEAGPFTYVPGSHRLTPQRRDWLHRKSMTAAQSADNETREGSFRIDEAELAELGLPPPRRFGVRANTLIVADTMGFHARGPSLRPSTRIEIWAYGRRNPFLPWLGADPAGLPIVKHHAVRLFWSASDVGEHLHLMRNPWRREGMVTPETPPDLTLFRPTAQQ